MVEVGSLNLQHLYELVVLLVKLLDLGKTFFVARKPPVEG